MEVCLLLCCLCWEREELNGEREKNKKLLLCTAIITVHICTVTVTSVQIYTFLHPLVWVVLEENCANFDTFCILQTFATTDVVALKEV